MKARTPLYSRSPQRPPLPGSPAPAPGSGAAGSSASTPATPAGPPAATSPDAAPASPPRAASRLGARLRRHERWLWAGAALLLAVAAGWPAWHPRPPAAMNLKALDAALRESIAKEPLPSAAAAAYAAVLPAVVRVVGHPAAAPGTASSAAQAGPPSTARRPRATPRGDDDAHAGAGGSSVGTGVVIVDSGLILTSLHVVDGAARITVTFADGSDSEAVIVNRQPGDDLAVLQVRVLPDDLHAATLRSTQGLAPGDEVLAVGFPFGIGPSASTGVVSGLKREFRAPDGGPVMSNLIQFDAAANPGNSGGPLVTMDGHVVGIVTAIMNPNQQRTFIGIGFAVPIENAAAAAGMPPF